MTGRSSDCRIRMPGVGCGYNGRWSDMPLRRRGFLLALPALLIGCVAPDEVNAAGLDQTTKRRIKAITNVFEVGGPEADYGYVEDLRDGRGFTVTNYGFCTNTREVSQVIQRHAARAHRSQLTSFLPRLPPHTNGTDTAALKDFPEVWRNEAKASHRLGIACEQVADRLFFRPAVKAAASFQLIGPLGLAIVYDTLLQHGDGEDADSLGAIHARTVDLAGNPEQAGELDFLFAFLEVRRDVLTSPANTATLEDWQASVTRVDALQLILTENPDLEPPIRVRNSEVDVTIA